MESSKANLLTLLRLDTLEQPLRQTPHFQQSKSISSPQNSQTTWCQQGAKKSQPFHPSERASSQQSKKRRKMHLLPCRAFISTQTQESLSYRRTISVPWSATLENFHLQVVVIARQQTMYPWRVRIMLSCQPSCFILTACATTSM